MDFFQRQAAARRSTIRLSIYFAISVVLIVIAVNAFVYFVVEIWTNNSYYQIRFNSNANASIPLWFWPTTLTLLTIGGGTLLSFRRLASGGRSVAHMMDARLVNLNTTDPREKRLINVVEEMSIASGTPVPQLYIQDGELGINAFVAGYHIREAVLVVTEGALANLTRDELQGVVGHEFSHILNGDMRINVKLIAVLAGIVLLSQFGSYMMRRRGYRRLARNGRNTMAMAGMGMLLFVIGYIGLFFGRLIKSAISRQREFLADAASIQFTRNPDGIAHALYKIKTHSGGSLLTHAHAEDMSHMCFGDTVSYQFSRLFATHPDIDERIKAVHPRFIPPRVDRATTDSSADSSADEVNKTVEAQLSPADMMSAVITSQVLLDSVGHTTPAHIDYARRIHAAISEPLRENIHEPLGARAVIYALVATQFSVEDYARAHRIVVEQDGEETAQRMADMLEAARALGTNGRLPLVELAFPALGRLHRDQKDRFVQTLEKIVRADKRYTLFEFALMTLIRKHMFVDPDADLSEELSSLDDVKDSLVVVLSLFVKLATKDKDKRKTLFVSTMQLFGFCDTPQMVSNANPETLTFSLMELDSLTPLLKRPVLNAFADCVAYDDVVKPSEFELLRAVCASLDCPMPPLLPQQLAVYSASSEASEAA